VGQLQLARLHAPCKHSATRACDVRHGQRPEHSLQSVTADVTAPHPWGTTNKGTSRPRSLRRHYGVLRRCADLCLRPHGPAARGAQGVCVSWKGPRSAARATSQCTRWQPGVCGRARGPGAGADQWLCQALRSGWIECDTQYEPLTRLARPPLLAAPPCRWWLPRSARCGSRVRSPADPRRLTCSAILLSCALCPLRRPPAPPPSHPEVTAQPRGAARRPEKPCAARQAHPMRSRPYGKYPASARLSPPRLALQTPWRLPTWTAAWPATAVRACGPLLHALSLANALLLLCQASIPWAWAPTRWP